MNGDCKYVRDGRDTDGTIWYRCTTHDMPEPSKDAPCAGYEEIPYKDVCPFDPDGEHSTKCFEGGHLDIDS